MEINNYRNFFFDLDKTIWNWDKSVTGAEDLIDTLKDAGKNVYFHTDNTLLSRKAYADKLSSMGIPAEEEDVITSGYVAAEVLAMNNTRKVYAAGEQGLVEELGKKNIEITEEASTAVMGLDRNFNYDKISKLKEIIERDGTVYTCSTEKTFRRESKELPHQRPFNSAVKEYGKVELVGKPTEKYRKVFKDYFDYFPGKSLFIGDRLADIETGNKLGMKTAAVLSGDISEKKLKKAEDEQVPDYVLTGLHKLRRRII
ncbi:HAD-IIA family hydrolase [Candidatus Nanosalina sp. VS9-1]|uniref:HAD-IIA family hydrolase n=1 Tax=Candidatus Nanosalina sp. VS9-1 TaxID=3388566 RepID=UPI0039DFBF18